MSDSSNAVGLDTLARQVRALLSEVKTGTSGIQLAPGDDFMKVLNLDSLDAVELTVRIHETFGIEFGAEASDIDALASFGSLVELIRARMRPAAHGVG